MADVLREAADRLNTTVDEVLEFLDSPAGRRLRRTVATGLVLSVPLIMRVPALKRTPLGRLVELAGGATLIVKLAEVIRDWERSEDARQVRAIDVQPS